MDPKEKKTKQEEELKVDDIQDTVEGQSQNEEATEATEPLTAEEKLEKELEEAQAQIEDQKTNTSGSRLNLTTTANVPSKKKPN